MSDTSGIFIERVRDEGQWFYRGERVEFFPGTGGRLQPALEKAALGPYEVLGCTRVYAEDTSWLDVRLSSVFSISWLHRRRQDRLRR